MPFFGHNNEQSFDYRHQEHRLQLPKFNQKVQIRDFSCSSVSNSEQDDKSQARDEDRQRFHRPSPMIKNNKLTVEDSYDLV